MKKILYRKLVFDCSVFFLISLLSTSIIIWIFQSVNYLDLVVEDGRDFALYMNYTLLNFPKIISKIYPFAVFFSFSYILTKYENNNELMIFWNHGVSKINLINFILRFSIFLTLFQLMLTVYVVPETQNISRSLIRTSNADFFESYIKPKKFNDNINDLTIYADKKNKNGELENIYLKKSEKNNDFQITIAKKGKFKKINNFNILVLYDGETINSVNNKLTNFSFSKSDFNLASMEADIVTDDKMQETRTTDHIECLKKYLNKSFKIDSKQKEYINHNCSLSTLNELYQELYKRLIVPLYIPLLILTSLILFSISKEKKNYFKSRLAIFFLGFVLIIISETFLRFIQSDFHYNLRLVSLPIILFCVLYVWLLLLFKNKIRI